MLAGHRKRSLDEVGLAPRELQVLRLIADGRSNDAVANELFLSIKSIEAIVRSIFLKLDLLENPARNRRVLAARAYLESPLSDTVAWPRWPSRFVGRVDEIAALVVAVAESPLTTVIGPGGIGKTRCVAQALSKSQGWFVDLVGSPPSAIAPRLFAACGIEAVSDSIGWRKLERLLAGCGDVVVLVLDNAEEQLEAVRAIVERLVAVAEVRVVVTSREPLEIPGERLVRLGPLSDDDAIALLIDRVVVSADPEATATVQARTALLAALDGMPLAIELAAVRLNSTSARWMGRQMVALLADLSRPGSGRQTSLNGVIDTSCLRLSADAQRLFRALSVFVGGFTVESVERCFADHVDDLGVARIGGDHPPVVGVSRV